MISGPPGSGKSTVAAAIAEQLVPSVLVAGDAFFGFLRGGIDPWLPESDAQNRMVVEAAAVAAGRFARGGAATVYDGVLGPWYLPEFVAATGLPAVDYAVLLPPRSVVLQRVADRRDHAFDDPAATEHMHQEFAGAPIDGRHRFEATGPPAVIIDQVLAAWRSGRLRWTASPA